MQSKVLSNAIWNAVNGSSAAVVAVLVPPFLTKLLTPEAYGAWALALQIGTYVSLFGLGIQLAVGRLVAFHEVREDYSKRDGVVATAFWFLTIASTVGWLAICCVAIWIKWLVPSLAPELVNQTRIAIILVGLALACNLPSSVFAAVFTGQQRSDIPGKVQGLGRVILAVGLVAAGLSRSLAILGLVYLLISLGTVLVLGHFWRTRTHAPTIMSKLVAARHGRELADFCVTLTVWHFSIILITGLDLVIVSRYYYAATPYYAVSITLVTLVSGVMTALANALVPAAAMIAHDETGAELRALLIRSSRLILGISIVVSAPLIFGGGLLLTLWIGPGYAVIGAPLLAGLTIAALLRNVEVPYVTTVIGVGYQKKMTLTPLFEGILTVVVALAVVRDLGAVGVAYSKIFSAAVGVMMVIGQHVLRRPLGGMTRGEYLWKCIVIPGRSIVPIGLVWVVCRYAFPVEQVIVPFVILMITTVVSVWLLSLSAEDRIFGYRLLSKVRSRNV